MAPTADMLDAVVAGDLEAAFTRSGYAAAKAPVFGVFATVPFGLGPEDMTSWMLEGDGSRIHREAYEKLGVAGIPCGIQGGKGGGWFRSDLNTVADFKGQRLRFGRYAGEIVSRMGATLVPLPPGEFFYQLQQGKVEGGEMSTPAIDAALGFDKLGLPYYVPGWQQPSAVLDFLMRQDKWNALPATMRAQIETACRANIAWMLSRSPPTQALALEKLRAAGVVIKPWSPELLEAFRKNTDIVLKDWAEHDGDFAAAWANQQKFVAQGVAWRSLSRLP
jgi:TRAP-type mannitol/chloroaromatic compound transport system substrate-binding protein